MLPLYLFCLVVGGGLLLFSLLGADPHGADPHGAGGAGDGGAPHADLPAHEGADYTHEFFSVRALIYFLAGFGAAGTLLDALTGAPPAVGALWATVSGVLAATGAAALFGWLRQSESGLVPAEADHLVGLAARVTVPLGPERRGKVVVVSGGREIELLARPFGPEDLPCPRGSAVVIVDVDGAVARVAPLPSLPSDPS